MICPHCGERALSTRQRFCHACGAPLHHAEAVAGSAPRGPVDGARAIGAPMRGDMLYWADTHRSRLVAYAVIGALAVVSLAIVAITLIATVIALAPFLLLLGFLLLAARLQWRRRGRVVRYHWLPRR